MAPRAENQKSCSSKTGKKTLQDELMEKLKLDEEKEKKKLEKEAKRRAELDKIKSESLARQASLLANEIKDKYTVQPKKAIMKPQPKPKSSSNNRQQSRNPENKFNQGSSYEPYSSNSKSKSSNYNKQQPWNSGNSSSSDSSFASSWKRNDSRNYQSNSCYNSDFIWGDSDEHFPELGAAAPVPQVNVWEERKSKREENKALEPRSEYDEESMLQKALALSILEAEEEEERKRKLDEEYKSQIALLECNPEILEDFDASDEFIVADKCEIESRNALQSTKEQCSKDNFSRNVAASNFRLKQKTSNSGGARPKINRIIENFGGWGLKNEKKEKFSNKLSNFVDDIVNNKSSERAGKCSTHPDYQKDVLNKNTNKQEKDVCSNNVNPWLISDTKFTKSSSVSDAWHSPDTKDSKNPVISNPWFSDTKNVKKSAAASDSWENDEILYDEKGTFTDIDEDDKLNYTVDYYDDASKENDDDKLSKDMSSNKVLDTWLNSDDENLKESASDGWDDGKEVDIGVENDKMGFSGSTNNMEKYDVSNKESVSDFVKTNIADTDNEKSETNICGAIGISSKAYVSAKDISSDVVCRKSELCHKNLMSQFENTYNYVVGNSDRTKDTPAPAQILPGNDVLWRNKASSNSIGSNPLTDKQNLRKVEFPLEAEPVKFQAVEESILSIMTSNNETDIPPILPPQPAPTVPAVSEENQAFTAEMSSTEFKGVSPQISPPQAIPELPSQFLYNPALFPGLNPMFGLGMDPITMRQMLMLSNPFFASQLLAMEQYYRSLGVPVDLFSFPAQAMPSMSYPGIMGTSMEQNTFPNTMNLNSAAVHDSQLQEQFASSQTVPIPGVYNSQLQNQFAGSQSVPVPDVYDSQFQQQYADSQSVPVSGSQVNTSNERPLLKHPPGLSADETITNASNALENDVDDSWYKNHLSNDSASAIPPPKPPTSNYDHNNLVSIPEPSEPSQSASSFNNSSTTNQYIPSNTVSDLLEVENNKPLSAIEACITKTEVTGWGDLEDDSYDIHNSKTNYSWEEDGWGTDNFPAKSVRNPSVYEDKKKTVYRQPARQPQLSRFQNNRRYN